MTAHTAADLNDSRLSAWVPSPGSPDSDLLPELRTITGRARDLVRNHPLAGGVKQTLADNVIGSQLRLSAQPQWKLLEKDKPWATEWGNKTEDEFETWADTTECDITRTQTLLGLTVQALTGALVNGDTLGVMLWDPRPELRWGTRVQVLEGDHLFTPPFLSNKDYMRSGIEVDRYGAPLYYWLFKKHPGDTRQLGVFGTSSSIVLAGVPSLLEAAKQDMWERVPAFTPWGRRQVIHFYDKDRAGQSRGKSIFTGVMREFKVAGDYMGAELQAAAANALIAAFLESNLDAESIAAIFGSDIKEATAYWKQVADKYNRKKMEGGMFVTLPVGTKLSGYNPQRPNTAFDGFMESILRHIAAGVNMPYELLLKDFSKTNYSSARAALLEAWRFFMSRRRWLQDHWLNPIYECWLEEAIAKGRVDAPDFYDNRYAYRKCRWVFSGRGWVDPVKEANAAAIRMENNLSTLEQECAEQGLDWEEVLAQRETEEYTRRRYHISPSPDMVAADSVPSENPPPEPDPAPIDTPADA